MTLTLGKLTLQSNLVQGPLAGYSTAPFRKAIWDFGGVGYCTTEMISANMLVHNRRDQSRFTWRDPSETLLCYQLSANNADDLRDACKIVSDLGADLIDLNCGCPVPKIRKKGAGSKHLSDPQKLASLIQTMRSSTDAVISIKVRVDSDSGDQFNQDIVNVVNDSDLDFLTVHGRHFSERYDVNCRYDEIAFFADRVNKPVIANGDVCSIDTLKQSLNTGCQGVMVARAGLGRPWLFAELQAALSDKPFTKPNTKTVIKLMLTHITELAELIGSEHQAILQARGFAKYYLRQTDLPKDILDALRGCQTIKALNDLFY
jgi:tRNA-dihydrouridine synthase B